MAKLRFLQGLYLPSLGKVVNLNDEIEVENEELAQDLVKNGYADALQEAVTYNKISKRKPKTVAKDA